MLTRCVDRIVRASLLTNNFLITVCALRVYSKRELSYTAASVDLKSGPVVTVNQGKLKGIESNLYDGTPYYSFKGIPYAQPPVGKLRFKAPLPPLPWNGVYDATKHGPICIQRDMFSKKIEGDEDCLFLNVYTRSLTPSSKKPVMVYIYGGAFMSGSGNSEVFGPKYLLQHDVVLVTINYRLEVLGFLCLDTEDVPGNAGMKDQTAALKWVNENIAQFGGDPSNITLFGESAGGVSVTYHMVSPMSKGLFHKAIAQSGVFLNSWGLSFNGRERAFRAGKVLGKETKDPHELFEFFQSVPAKDLTALTFSTMTSDEKHRGLPMYFAPVVEKKFKNVESFINEEPANFLLQNKICDIPLMIGYTSAEGIMVAPNTIKKLDLYNKNFHYKVMKDIARKVPEAVQKEFGERIKRYYFGNNDATENDINQIIVMESDLQATYGIHLFLHLYIAFAQSPVYLYNFKFDSDLNMMKNKLGLSHLKGASHADDVYYLFSTAMTEDVYKEQKSVRDMVFTATKLWTDFAKTGNPTPDGSLGVKWEPHTKESKAYLNIDNILSMDKNINQQSIAFWNKLYCESGLPSIAKISL